MKFVLFLLIAIAATGCYGETHTFVPGPDPGYLAQFEKKINCDPKSFKDHWFDLLEYGGFTDRKWKLVYHVRCVVDGLSAEFSETVSSGNTTLTFPQ